MCIISAAQFTLGLSSTHFPIIDATSDAQITYKIMLPLVNWLWYSHDIPIPDGHTARYIYVYQEDVRTSSSDPKVNLMEIEAYPPFTYGMSLRHAVKSPILDAPKSPNLNVSRLVSSCPCLNLLKPCVKSRMKMQLEQRRQAMLQLHRNDQQFDCLLRCV